MDIECKLEDLIKERGLKKGYISEKAGISRATLTLILKGTSLPTLPVAFKIAEVMGLSVEEIWQKK
ncbi:helix-turn-helix transcriptional regulator [Fictibacillus terranigra]|uniref:Helix-turn-helix transcriptional regulator n=1 Tax=Fictibacillus terranigra TaxID=3058424 RepID=A0ABT8E6X3_9BACL|nr:helix-turn-helix transcriptional regulator [Fictibacillus sp. CENA-BCM004]MDN4073640.1 helix-turn-helix transcriptional regulator [Fictibacillus sp. CENA-BCM004]